MELKLNIAFEQLQFLAMQLPANQKKELITNLLNDNFFKKKDKKENDEEFYSLQKLLLNGPVMTNEQFNNYKDLRNNFNSWTENLFA